ncbi:MAG: polysaccharide deacetylase family protein [Magnetococcales bacterium]|nr:polysaccharide deacetylase family protein [Magnetococcales bacterium]
MSFPFLGLYSWVTDRLFPGKRGCLRVVLFHDVALEHEQKFVCLLDWLGQSWRFVSPRQFELMISGQEPVEEDSLLVTFDDGFASNRLLAERVLNPRGIKALFFIVSEFADLAEGADWRGFVAKNIYPDLKPHEVPSHGRNMSWSDLEFLLETGHVIGGHTAHHARLSGGTLEELQAEIIGGAISLEQRLGIQIQHFAFTFGDLASASPEALAVARTRFPFIYTGLRGNNGVGVPPWAIRRDSLRVTDPLSLAGALLKGGADYYYRMLTRIYESWGVKP